MKLNYIYIYIKYENSRLSQTKLQLLAMKIDKAHKLKVYCLLFSTYKSNYVKNYILKSLKSLHDEPLVRRGNYVPLQPHL